MLDLVLAHDTFGPLVSAYYGHQPALMEYLESPTRDKFTTDEEVYDWWVGTTDRSPTTNRISSKELEEMCFKGRCIP